MSKNSIFSTRLSQLRSEKRLTQAELAKKSDLPPGAISHFETGFRFPTAQTLLKLANALEISTDYLLGREQEPRTAGPRVQAIFRMASDMSPDALDALESFAEHLGAKEKKADKTSGRSTGDETQEG